MWIERVSSASHASLELEIDELVSCFIQHLQCLSGEFFRHEYIIGVEGRDREDGDEVIR